MDILLLGPPGVGKGTQGAILSERMGLPRFATGDLLRDAVRQGTPLGLEAKAAMEAGLLISDDLILGILADELAKPTSAGGVIFDGVVRTIPQAEGMERLLKASGRQIDHVLFFDAADEQLIRRIAGRRLVESRVDDDPATVASRLDAYRGLTSPVIAWYEARGVLHRIPALGTVEQVASLVRHALTPQ